MTLLNPSFPTDYTGYGGIDYTVMPDWGIDYTGGNSSVWTDPIITGGDYGTFDIPSWEDGLGVDFGGGSTTGGNTGFWNQGLGGNILGGLTDFGIAGATAGLGTSYMNKAQQAQQVQAERAAQAIRKKNIWSVGAQIAANTNEYERQRDAEKWKRANLNDPNVLWDQERTMLAKAAVAGIKPQDAAHYAFIT